MMDEPKNGAASSPALPAVTDRATFQAELDKLRVREKAHTREGDAIAAARRRLPMTEIDASLPLTGPQGPLTLLEAFEGRRQLIAYYFMWDPGHPAAEQCEGCTWVTTQITELSYLHSRDITYAVFCQGPYDESARYRDFMGWDMPWYSAQDSLGALLTGRRIGLFHLVCYLRDGDRVFETYWTTRRGAEAMDYSYALMDLTVYGRQEPWEDSPPGWPQQCSITRTADGPPAWPPVPEWPAGAPSPSGRACKPGALTTSAAPGADRQEGLMMNEGPGRRRPGLRIPAPPAARSDTRCRLSARPPRGRRNGGRRDARDRSLLVVTPGVAAAYWVVAAREVTGMGMGTATRLWSFGFFDRRGGGELLPSRAVLDVPLALAIVVIGVLTIVDPSSVPGLTPI